MPISLANNIISSDPGNEFIKEIHPNKRQEDFLSIPDSVFEALYGGSAYSGKSYLLTLMPLIRGFYKFRGFKGLILRRKFPDLERENIRLSQEYYPSTGAKYNEQKHTWHWEEYGSYVDFGHIQHSSDVRQYDSSQYNYVNFDELTSFEESQYIYLVGSRVRPSSSFNVAIVRSGTNPGGIGQTFVFNRFVKPCESGYKLIKDSKTGLSRIFIPAFAQDNTHGMEYDPLYLQKLELLPENEKRAKKYGDWHAFEGSVFPEFRPIKFPNEPENALHVIEPFTIPEWWPKVLSIDWGKRAMCHAMWAAVSPDNRVYIYRERTWLGVDVPFWASEIGEISFKENINYCTLCGSAWQERGTETIAGQFHKYSHIKPYSSENTPGSRITGLQLIHDFFRWEQKKLRLAEGNVFNIEKAQHIFRNFGAEAYENYKSFFIDEPNETLPKLQIFNTCTVLIETIPVCIHDEKRKEDIQEFSGDDPIDNLRYLCKAIIHFMNQSPAEMERRKAIENAITRLNNGGDQTQFYRHMESLEESSKEVFGVRRHHSNIH